MFPSFKAYLKQQQKISRKVLEMTFYVPELITNNFIPGQYFVFLINDNKHNTIQRRAYSVVDIKDKQLTFAALLVDGGLASKFFLNLKPEQCCEIIGPLGEFTLQAKEPINKLVFVGTNTGIVPYISMLQSVKNLMLKKHIKEVHVIMGLESREDMIYQDVFYDFIGQEKNKNFYLCFSQEKLIADLKYAYHGYVQHIIKQLKLDNQDEVYLCGNQAMIEQTSSLLRSSGMEKIYFERFY